MKDYKKLASGVVILAMLAGMTGCDAIKNLTKKNLIKEDMVSEAAGDYADALIALDSKKLKSEAWELKETTEEFVDEFKFEESSKEVYEAWLKTFKYEVSDDEIEIKDEEASVPVVFEYVDLGKLSTDSYTAEEWIDAIKDAKKTEELEVEMKFYYDGEEEKLFVDNGDKVIKKFYEVVNTYIYINEFVFYDDAIKGEWASDSFKYDDELKIKLEFADIKGIDGKSVNYILTDPSYKQILEGSLTIAAGGSTELSIKPSDCKLDEFEGGFYNIQITDEDSTIYFSSSTYVDPKPTPTPSPVPTEDPEATDETDESGETKETDETQNTSSVKGVGDVKFVTPSEETFGKTDSDKRVYKNEYFNVQFTYPESLMPIDAALFGDTLDQDGEYHMDFLATDDKFSTMFMVMIAQFDEFGENVTAEEAIAYIAMADGAGSDVKVETVKLGEVEAYTFANDDGLSFYILFKEQSMFVFAGQDMQGDGGNTELVKEITDTFKKVS